VSDTGALTLKEDILIQTIARLSSYKSMIVFTLSPVRLSL